jgi:hypothetical protein
LSFSFESLSPILFMAPTHVHILMDQPYIQILSRNHYSINVVINYQNKTCRVMAGPALRGAGVPRLHTVSLSSGPWVGSDAPS